MVIIIISFSCLNYKELKKIHIYLQDILAVSLTGYFVYDEPNRLILRVLKINYIYI